MVVVHSTLALSKAEAAAAEERGARDAARVAAVSAAKSGIGTLSHRFAIHGLSPFQTYLSPISFYLLFRVFAVEVQ